MNTQYEYPMWFKDREDGSIVKVDNSNTATLIVSNTDEFESGKIFKDISFLTVNGDFWEDVTNLYKQDGELSSSGIPFKIIERPKVPHYQSGGIEPIDYINSHNFNFNIGNCIKYCSRAGLKGDAIEDLQKAIHYLQFEIERLKNV